MKDYDYRHIAPQVVECLECGTPFYGRPDKKFCCLTCKNRYHNKRKQDSNDYRSRTIRVLDTNYSILHNLLTVGKKTAYLADLAELGFNPDIATSTAIKKHGRVDCRCFDIEYTRTVTRITDLRKIG